MNLLAVTWRAAHRATAAAETAALRIGALVALPIGLYMVTMPALPAG